jgi:uncharacterized protein (TIGR01777 family)
MNDFEPPAGGNSPETIAVTGSSGLIGSALVQSLREQGYQVRRVVRSGASGSDLEWHPARGVLDPDDLRGVGAVVHLAGENVGERWTAEKKRRIRESRVAGTGLLSNALAELGDAGPRVLVSASAIGFYGDRGEQVLPEDSGTGSGFLAGVTREWEAATQPAERAGVRVVNLRFGVVLSEEGGALSQMLLPFKLGAGGKLGSGEQWMSWVALPDAVAAIRFALEHDELSGPVNVVAPHPVTNAEFTAALGSALHRPALFTVPAFALRLALGQMADEALLASQHVEPRRLLEAGFQFHHPEIREALRAVL